VENKRDFSETYCTHVIVLLKKDYFSKFARVSLIPEIFHKINWHEFRIHFRAKY